MTSYIDNFLLIFGEQPLRGVLGEAALDHLLDAQGLDSQQVQNHVVRKPELGRELRGRPENHIVQDGLLNASAANRA